MFTKIIENVMIRHNFNFVYLPFCQFIQDFCDECPLFSQNMMAMNFIAISIVPWRRAWFQSLLRTKSETVEDIKCLVRGDIYVYSAFLRLEGNISPKRNMYPALSLLASVESLIPNY